MEFGNDWKKTILTCLVDKNMYSTYMYVYSTHKETRRMYWRKLGAWEGLWGVVMLTEQRTLRPAAHKCQDWLTHQTYT